MRRIALIALYFVISNLVVYARAEDETTNKGSVRNKDLYLFVNGWSAEPRIWNTNSEAALKLVKLSCTLDGKGDLKAAAAPTTIKSYPDKHVSFFRSYPDSGAFIFATGNSDVDFDSIYVIMAHNPENVMQYSPTALTGLTFRSDANNGLLYLFCATDDIAPTLTMLTLPEQHAQRCDPDAWRSIAEHEWLKANGGELVFMRPAMQGAPFAYQPSAEGLLPSDRWYILANNDAHIVLTGRTQENSVILAYSRKEQKWTSTRIEGNYGKLSYFSGFVVLEHMAPCTLPTNKNAFFPTGIWTLVDLEQKRTQTIRVGGSTRLLHLDKDGALVADSDILRYLPVIDSKIVSGESRNLWVSPIVPCIQFAYYADSY